MLSQVPPAHETIRVSLGASRGSIGLAYAKIRDAGVGP